MNICVYGAASDKISDVYIKEGEKLGYLMAKGGHRLVFGGGGAGMMGAAARGVNDAGGESLGVVPNFFRGDGKTVDGILYEESTKVQYCDTMMERKEILRQSSDAFIITPGGTGTYDEFFEIYTLKKLNQFNKEIIILNINGYFDALLNMLEKGVEEGFMDKEDLDHFEVFTTAEETMRYINSI